MCEEGRKEGPVHLIAREPLEYAHAQGRLDPVQGSRFATQQLK